MGVMRRSIPGQAHIRRWRLSSPGELRRPGRGRVSRRASVSTTVRRCAGGAVHAARSVASGGAAPQDAPATSGATAPPTPTGWVVAPPDFVGVGAPRCGTGWWDALLHQHPGVARAPGVPREIRAFGRFWSATWTDADTAAYHAWFPRPAGSLAGEWTPDYLLDPWTPALLRRAAPDARLLVLLRDPVERFRSDRAQDLADPTRRAVAPRAAANAAFGRGLYADGLVRLWRAFSRDRTLVLQLERCVRDPQGQLRRTCAFLGLDPEPVASIEVDRTEATGAPRAALSLEQRTTLVARYAPENARLAALLGDDLDLSLWTTS